MNWPASTEPPMAVVAPSSQGAQTTPGRPARAAAGLRSHRFWWALATVVLALAMVFCLWFARPLLPVKFVPLPPGVTYVDELGTAFTVVQRLEQIRYEDSFEVFEPAPGAVYLEYTVQVDGFQPDIINNRHLNMCTFQLVGANGQIWDSLRIYLDNRQSFCDRDAATSSFQVYSIYEVPEQMLDEVLGLVPERIEMNPHWGRELVISEPQ